MLARVRVHHQDDLIEPWGRGSVLGPPPVRVVRRYSISLRYRFTVVSERGRFGLAEVNVPGLRQVICGPELARVRYGRRERTSGGIERDLRLVTEEHEIQRGRRILPQGRSLATRLSYVAVEKASNAGVAEESLVVGVVSAAVCQRRLDGLVHHWVRGSVRGGDAVGQGLTTNVIVACLSSTETA